MSPEAWKDVGRASDLPEGGRIVSRFLDRELVVLRLEGQLFAVEGQCPHRGGSLGHGDRDGFRLSCPQHAWCFDVRTGEGFFPLGARIATYEVQERDGRILVAARGAP